MTELQAVTKPMLDAWVAWEPGYDPEPPLTPKQSAFVRHAFYAGWFASQASPPPLSDEVERLRKAAEPFAKGVVIDPTKKRGDRHWATFGTATNLDQVIELQEAIAALTAMKGTGDGEALSLHKDDRDGD